MKINLNVVQYNQWKKVRDKVKEDMKYKTINAANAAIITKLHADLFNHKAQRPCCPSAWLEYIEAINAAFAAYTKKHESKVEPDVVDTKPKAKRKSRKKAVIQKSKK